MASKTDTTLKKKKTGAGAKSKTKTAAKKAVTKTPKARVAKKTIKKTTKSAVAKKTARKKAKTAVVKKTAPVVDVLEMTSTENVAVVEAIPDPTPADACRPDCEDAAVAILEAEPEPEAGDATEPGFAVETEAPTESEAFEESIDGDESPVEPQAGLTDAEKIAPNGTAAPGDELQLVCFTLDDEEYGLDIQKVQEINRVSRVTTVPDAPAYVKGIIDLRGRVIPIVDLRLRLGYAARDDDKHSRIVVLDFDGNFIGLIVDAVTEVLRVSHAKIERTPEIAATTNGECLEGIVQLDAKMLLVIDCHKILQF